MKIYPQVLTFVKRPQIWLFGLGGHTVKNLRRLAGKFDLDQSERKSSQVTQTDSQVDASCVWLFHVVVLQTTAKK